jgi:hypothetical protein
LQFFAFYAQWGLWCLPSKAWGVSHKETWQRQQYAGIWGAILS